jgi:hypothetical protein
VSVEVLTGVYTSGCPDRLGSSFSRLRSYLC